MTERTSQLLREALALPADERAELVDRVLDSLDSEARRAVDDAWAAEAEDRIDAYDRGDLASSPASDVFARLRNRTRS